MFRDPMVENDLLLGRTDAVVRETQVEEALSAYQSQHLALRFVGDRGIEYLPEDPFQAEVQIKSLLGKGYILRQDAEEGFYLSRGLSGGMMVPTPIAALEKKLDMKPEGKVSVFITYQWAQKDIAIAVHKAFEAKGFLVIRDEDTLHNGVYIQEFMKVITHPKLDYVLPIISASYLKSKNCMYEVNQIMKRHHWETSLLPYVVNCDKEADARIYGGIVEYTRHWQEQRAKAEDLKEEGLRDRGLFENILRNIEPFTTAITTRIQIPEAELIASDYKALFETVSEREFAREGARFKEIEELLQRASIREKTKKHDKTREAFEEAVVKVDELEHVRGIEQISGKVYGLYGEYLLRQKETEEGQEKLEIASNFGYVSSSTDTQALKAEEQRQTKLRAEEIRLKELKESSKLEESRLKKLEEARKAEEARLKKVEDDRKTQEQRQAKLKAEETRKADEARLKKVEDDRKAEELAAAKKPEASPSNVLLFKGPTPNAQELSQFLRLVAEGEQEQAEAMLQKNRDLALFAGNVKDLSGRTFEGITGFQYALWALDSHMWTMLRGYLPDEQAAAQLMTTGSWVSTHGLHAGMPGGPLDKLTTALKTYVDNYSAWYQKDSGYKTIEEHWQKQVGGAQLLLPAHVINEYCRPDRSFVPCPSFTEPTLPRTRKFDKGEWFTASYNGGKLGDKFGVLRYSFGSGEGRTGVYGRAWVDGAVAADHKSLTSLLTIRSQQREQLLTELSQHTGLDGKRKAVAAPK